jgi:hypothetical protein
MGRCISPFRKKESGIDLPCGKCYECKARRVSGWSFRLMKEAEVSTSAFFVTLTYAPEYTKTTKNGFMNLDKRDLQLFMKRLRKRNENKLKYYAVGEYGGKTDRPHYHIILLNADVETIQYAWELGEIHIGDVNESSIGYTLKYVSKESRIPKHQNDDRQKEFSLMSKRMGENYLTSQMINWHLNENAILDRMYCNLKDGKKIAMPRYYRDKIYSDFDKFRIQKHMERQECAKGVDKTREKIMEEMKKEDLIRINKAKKAQKEQRFTII